MERQEKDVLNAQKRNVYAQYNGTINYTIAINKNSLYYFIFFLLIHTFSMYASIIIFICIPFLFHSRYRQKITKYLSLCFCVSVWVRAFILCIHKKTTVYRYVSCVFSVIIYTIFTRATNIPKCETHMTANTPKKRTPNRLKEANKQTNNLNETKWSTKNENQQRYLLSFFICLNSCMVYMIPY